MINIYEDLQTLGKPIYAIGDAPTILPSEYYTVSEDSTSDNLNADNDTYEILYEFTLQWYTNNASHIYDGLNEAIALLKSKGYIVSGVGYHNATFKDWFSRQVDVKKIDHIK